MQNQKPQLQLTEELLKSSTPLIQDGNQIFCEGVILRKISKFLIAQEQDGVVPVPIFYDPQTGKVLLETLPKFLREEFENYNKTKEPETVEENG